MFAVCTQRMNQPHSLAFQQTAVMWAYECYNIMQTFMIVRYEAISTPLYSDTIRIC